MGLAACLVVALVRSARADCGDAVTDDRCDFGDRASGRRPAETETEFFARKQAEVERELAWPAGDGDVQHGAGGRRRAR
jgi:hypothetical protein